MSYYSPVSEVPSLLVASLEVANVVLDLMLLRGRLVLAIIETLRM